MFRKDVRPEATTIYAPLPGAQIKRVEKPGNFSPDKLDEVAMVLGIPRSRVMDVEYHGGEWTDFSDRTFRRTGFEGIYRLRDVSTDPEQAQGTEFFIAPNRLIEIERFNRQIDPEYPNSGEMKLLTSPRPQIGDPLYEGRTYGVEAHILRKPADTGTQRVLSFIEVKPVLGAFVHSPLEAVRRYYADDPLAVGENPNLDWIIDTLDQEGATDLDILKMMCGSFRNLSVVTHREQVFTRGWPSDLHRKALHLSSQHTRNNLETCLSEALEEGDKADPILIQWLKEDLAKLEDFQTFLTERKKSDVTGNSYLSLQSLGK